MDYSYSDVDNARRLVKSFNGEVVYSPSFGWLVWDGKKWCADDSRSVYTYVDQLRAEVEATHPKDHEVDNYRKLLARLKSRHSIQDMLSIAKTMPETLSDELDADAFALNVRNGIVDLRTGKLKQHDKDAKITQLTDIEYDPSETAPKWELFLDQIMCGRKDLVDFLQRAIGYSLTGSTAEQCLFILYGKGWNGKSKFIEVMRHMFGSYAKNTNPVTFTTSKTFSIRNDLARLKEARFVTAIEFAPEGPFKLDGATVKNMTGDDTINARFLYGEEFEFMPCFKLWMATNHLPEIPMAEEAIWRRIRVIPFEARFSGANEDKAIKEKLVAEEKGILNWMVKGCMLWQEHGLEAPDAVKVAISAYRDESNPLAPFVMECCYLHPQATVPIKDLYVKYMDWCIKNREQYVSKKVFGRILVANHKISNFRTANCRFFSGIGLNKTAVFTELIDDNGDEYEEQ